MQMTGRIRSSRFLVPGSGLGFEVRTWNVAPGTRNSVLGELRWGDGGWTTLPGGDDRHQLGDGDGDVDDAEPRHRTAHEVVRNELVHCRQCLREVVAVPVHRPGNDHEDEAELEEAGGIH